MPTHTTVCTKKTPKSATAKEAKADAPGSSQAPKVSEAELRQQHKDAQLMDEDFGAWHDQMISEGHNGWKKCTEMHCDHGEAHKELQH